MNNVMFHAMPCRSTVQPGKSISSSGIRHWSSSCSDSTTAASFQPHMDAKPAVKAPLLPLLGGPKFSCCLPSQNKQPAFCSKKEAQQSWMDFANEGRSWEGAEIIIQLSVEDTVYWDCSLPC